MIKIVDAGHVYELLTLDGKGPQVLTFVKRCDQAHPERFPGNTDAFEGTNLQSVIRCLIDRIGYLDNQISHRNNGAVARKLAECLWLLEDRAAERHGYSFDYRVEDMVAMPMCSHCGHVVCPLLRNTVKEGYQP